MAYCFKIGDVSVPAPAPGGYHYSCQTLASGKGTERSQINGEVTINYIAVKRTVEFKYNAMNVQTIRSLLKELDVENAVTRKYITCTVLTPLGETYTGTFYCSGYDVDLEHCIGGPDKAIWTGLSFTLVEK